MPTATSQLAELINALASLAWPLVLFFFLWLFSSEITALFKRFTRLKGPGGFEVELSDALENLGRKTQEAALTLPDGVTQSEQRDDSGRGPDEGEGIEPAKTPEPPDQGPGGESKQPDGDEELLLADQDIDEKPSSGETRPGVLNAWTKYLQEHPELLRENPETVPAAEKESVEQAIASLKKSLEGGDIDAIKSGTEQLAAEAQKLGTAMYAHAQASQAGAGATSGDADAGAAHSAEDEVVDAEIVDDEGTK